MNKEAFLQLADLIEANPKHFNLDNFLYGEKVERGGTDKRIKVTSCGTAACVAGWANYVARGSKPISWMDASDVDTAADFLGIDEWQAHRLFYADAGAVWGRYADKFGWEVTHRGRVCDWGQITARQAAKVLRDIAYRKVRL